MGGESLVVAERTDRLLGLAWFLPTGMLGTAAYLRTLAVVPDAQGEGIGSRLLETFESKSRGAGGCFLLVSDFNVAALAFYQRRGYHEVGKLDGFVIPGVTELLLWKSVGRLGEPQGV
jgi:ribosomal protein S18 acetylase RimI-like enzyme